jgi:hypothetical protein
MGVDSGLGPTAAPGFDSTFEPVHSEDRQGRHRRVVESKINIISHPHYIPALKPQGLEKVAMDRFVDQTDFVLRLVGYGKWVGFDIHDKKVVKSSKSTSLGYCIR